MDAAATFEPISSVDTADQLRGIALHREFVRLGLDDAHVTSAAGDAQAERAHNIAVGKTWRLIWELGPVMAEAFYNKWAQEHGYAVITYLGELWTADGVRVALADMQTAVIGLGSDGSVWQWRGSLCQQP